jgi:UDP-3-O-[3-hydroxymyristoyl] glucosamine N-acyltransferase
VEITLGQIAEIVDGVVEGDKNIRISGISGIREAKPGDITFVSNAKYAPLIETTRASAVVVAEELNSYSIPMVRVKNPDLAFALIVDAFAPEPIVCQKGIHPTAIIGEDVKLGKDISIQAFTVVQDGAEIGDETVIYPGVYIGHYTKIGKNCLIYPRVVIRERITIGDNCIIHSGTVVGADGFGYSTVEGVHHKIPQVGTVLIEDDVEIGANVTIDRARFDKTVIKKGTKIDNLVQIAHNVIIGEHSRIIAQTAIAGSTTIGSNVILAGQSGVDGHIHIGDNVVVAAKAGVTKDVPSNVCVSGFPAHSHEKELKMQACLRKLPELFKAFKKLSEKVKQIEESKNHK